MLINPLHHRAAAAAVVIRLGTFFYDSIGFGRFRGICCRCRRHDCCRLLYLRVRLESDMHVV